tara:strand:- start:141 stop:374 length:234 start_codon:yes stop_codon:yes gene_type:complete
MKRKKMIDKEKELNPVSKARKIADHIADYDVLLSMKLIGILTHELTSEEIHKIYLRFNLNLNMLDGERETIKDLLIP